jgi:VanZ family protein
MAKLVRFFRLLARWLFLPAVAVVVWGELKPSTHGPDTGFDKILHFTAYFGLAGIATVALGHRRPALWAALALASFGGILEIVQGFVGRDAEWGDEAANILGAGAGFAAGLLALNILRRMAGTSRAPGGANETVR